MRNHQNTTIKREWLSGGASPCQGEGRGFDSRLALFFYLLGTEDNNISRKDSINVFKL